jgi:hypothetical protein
MTELVVSFFLSLIGKLGVIDEVKIKLLGTPDLANDKLVVALEETEKIYQLVENMLSTYLSVEFDQTSRQDERKVLVKLEGGELLSEVEQARPICRKIERIYMQYLRVWFGKYLEEDEQLKMEGLFQQLGTADDQLVDQLIQIAKWLTEEAKATLDLVDGDDLDAANRRIKAARKEVLPFRQVISDSMRKLFALQADFLQALK